MAQATRISLNQFPLIYILIKLGGASMADIKYEIIEKVGVLSDSAKGWTKELNLISWNGREPKYDLRDWAPEHEKMGKGVTLSVEELRKLRNILNGLENL